MESELLKQPFGAEVVSETSSSYPRCTWGTKRIIEHDIGGLSTKTAPPELAAEPVTEFHDASIFMRLKASDAYQLAGFRVLSDPNQLFGRDFIQKEKSIFQCIGVR